MTNRELVVGVDTYLLYAEESTYKTGVTPTTHFGLDQAFTENPSRNLVAHRGVGGSATSAQEVQSFTTGKFEGRFSVDFRVMNFAHMKYVLGAVSGSGTSGSPYNYTRADRPTSLTVGIEVNNTTTDSRRWMLGCLCENYTLKVSEGEPPMATMDFYYADYSNSTTIDANTATASGDPYSFEGGTFEAPTNTPLSQLIDSATVTITSEYNKNYGLNITPASFGRKSITYKLGMTFKYYDDTLYTQLLGQLASITTPGSFATASLKFTNGSSKYAYFNFTGVYLDNGNYPNRLGETMTEEINFIAKQLTVVERTS